MGMRRAPLRENRHVDNCGPKRRETLCRHKVSVCPDHKLGADLGECWPRQADRNVRARDWTERSKL